MIQPFRNGAMVRAYVMAGMLIGLSMLVIAPHAHAAPGRPAWSCLPGDLYRGGANPYVSIDGFAGPFDDRGAPSGAPFPRNGVAALVRAKAEMIGVPVQLALAIARFESGFRMAVRGAAGERGAMQVLPQTARQVGISGDLYGPAGIEAGVRYLALALRLHRKAGWCAVASAYNTGVWRGSRCTAYGRTVMALAGRP